MQPTRRTVVLVFEDQVGISKGYRPLFDRIANSAGLTESTTRFILRMSYRSLQKNHLLQWSGNRKHPGFHQNPAYQSMTRAWIEQCINTHEPDFIVCMDPALLFVVNPNWDQATLDKLRGGVYLVESSQGRQIPWLVTLPMSSYHSKVSSKDIAKLNEGFTEKADFEEWRNGDSEDETAPDNEEEEMEWHEPIQIPMGNIMLMFDFAKLSRLIQRWRLNQQ